MINQKELCKKAEDFVNKDIKVIDDYLNECFKNFAVEGKYASAIVGLCKLCYAQGYVDCCKDNQKG